MSKTLEQSFTNLYKNIQSEDYKGYDPYDTLLSWFPFHWLGKWGPVLAIQFQKRNPINLRPLLGIRKEINPKAFGLFLQAYSILYKKKKSSTYLDKMEYFFKWLCQNYSKGFTGKGWGYNFPWASPEKYLEKYVPSAVVTAFVCKGIYHYYIATGDEKAVKVLHQAKEFILNELPVYEDESGQCISYTPLKKDICYNASLLAGEVLAMNYAISNEEFIKEKCEALVNFVVQRQFENGSWAYSENIETGDKRMQIDFHQGYVIESIYEIEKLLDIKRNSWELSIKKGLEFYRNEQFFDNGQSLWRLPKLYPIDIHNQSQGIITFSKLSEYQPEYLDFAVKIAEFTIKNMQAKDGHFYYRKYKKYKNPISYMRWNNAWMFLALVTLISNK